MFIDIVFLGILNNFIFRRRTRRYMKKINNINRNCVYVDQLQNNVYHIKKNAIHMYISSNDHSNLKEINRFLSFVFRDTLIGVQTDDTLYDMLEQECSAKIIKI